MITSAVQSFFRRKSSVEIPSEDPIRGMRGGGMPNDISQKGSPKGCKLCTIPATRAMDATETKGHTGGDLSESEGGMEGATIERGPRNKVWVPSHQKTPPRVNRWDIVEGRQVRGAKSAKRLGRDRGEAGFLNTNNVRFVIRNHLKDLTLLARSAKPPNIPSHANQTIH